MPIDLNESVIVSLHGRDIVDEFKSVYGREPTEREYEYIKYVFTDKFDTHWIRESLQNSVHDAIDYAISKEELPELPSGDDE